MNALTIIIVLVSTIFLKFKFTFTVINEDQVPDPGSCLVVTPRQELCLDNIYRDLQCKRPQLTKCNRIRTYLPKKFFDTVDFYKLKSDDAQNYFMYFYNIITTKEPKTEPFVMLNIFQFCDQATTDALENGKCKNRLSNIYSDSNDTTEILQHAFLNLVVTKFKTKDYAMDYYLHIEKFFGFSVKNTLLKLPEDFCIGTSYSLYSQSQLSRKRGFNDNEAGSSKSKKVDSSND